MKKIIAAAAGLMMVGVMASSASAVESQFGGYWRTRAFSAIDFDNDSGTQSRVDTRTRLYYTAVFNEDFKFVNKFEFNTTWGDANGGDVGTDGVGHFRVKHSYIDVAAGATRWTVGMQGAVIGRGFIFDDDAAGAIGYFEAGNSTIPVAWLSVREKEAVGFEGDIYATMPVIKLSDSTTINPYLVYGKGDGVITKTNADENLEGWYAGIDFDMNTDAFGGWGTFIYQFGEVNDVDISAFLLAGGITAGPVNAQAFYATGQDANATDVEAFAAPAGTYYNWAEIMGDGIFDAYNPIGAGTRISNIWAAQVGAKIKPMDKMTLSGDIWYAQRVEEIAPGLDKELGWEFDVKMGYALLDNLKLDLVAAYLVAGDSTGTEDPVEIGARLSLSF